MQPNTQETLPPFEIEEAQLGYVLRKTRVRESNRKLTNRLQEIHMKQVCEEAKAYRVDLNDTKTFNFTDPFFDWQAFREGCHETARRMREAGGEGVHQALLRAGINNIANNWYNLVETLHESIGSTTVSSHAIELYAPMYRGQVPKRVLRGQSFPESRLVNQDLQMPNWKFGLMATFEYELWEDDQTGQIAQRAQDIGENMRILEDAWFFQRFIGSAGSYGGDPIDASATYTTVWDATNYGNKPTVYVAFSSKAVQDAHDALLAMKDPLGNKMLVNPNTLLVGTSQNFPARTLLNSQWYPSTATMKQGGGTTETYIGTSFAANVLQGLYNLVVSRFFPATGVALGEAGKGIIMQRRTPTSVMQENPQSGASFQFDEYRFRSRARWNPDWIEPRFWYLINDGSVT